MDVLSGPTFHFVQSSPRSSSISSSANCSTQTFSCVFALFFMWCVICPTPALVLNLFPHARVHMSTLSVMTPMACSVLYV